jgi:hypothetical protein
MISYVFEVKEKYNNAFTQHYLMAFDSVDIREKNLSLKEITTHYDSTYDRTLIYIPRYTVTYENDNEKIDLYKEVAHNNRINLYYWDLEGNKYLIENPDGKRHILERTHGKETNGKITAIRHLKVKPILVKKKNKTNNSSEGGTESFLSEKNFNYWKTYFHYLKFSFKEISNEEAEFISFVFAYNRYNYSVENKEVHSYIYDADEKIPKELYIGLRNKGIDALILQFLIGEIEVYSPKCPFYSSLSYVDLNSLFTKYRFYFENGL